MRLFKILVSTSALIAVFILYSGRLGALTILASIVVAVIISSFIAKEFPCRSIRGLFYLLPLAVKFIEAEIREHLAMAKVILSQKTELHPVIVDIPLDVDTDVSIAVLSYIVTNTPGTIVVDVDRERKIMRVHWLFPTTRDPIMAKKSIIGDFEKYLKKAFG